MKISILEYNRKEYIDNVLNAFVTENRVICNRFDFNPNDGQEQLKNFVNDTSDARIVVIHENRFLERAILWLKIVGVKDIYVVRPYTIDKGLDFLNGMALEQNKIVYDYTLIDHVFGEKPYLVHLETHVVDHCNLNCKACNNFSPFVREEKLSDIVSYRRDISNLAEVYSGIGRFFLLGGEPLLAPELCCEMIRVYREFFPTGELRLLTNASLILKMKKNFWNVIREYDVIIHISLYPPIKDMINVIEERLIENNVKYLIFRRVEKFLKHWTKYPFEDAEYNNLRCGSAGCHFLRDGIIYKCPEAYLISNIGKEGEKIKSDDGIRIVDNDGELINEKLIQPIDMCSKCSYMRAEAIKWEPVGDIISECDWFLKNRLEYENEQLEIKLKELIKEKEQAEVHFQETIKGMQNRLDSSIASIKSYKKENKTYKKENKQLEYNLSIVNHSLNIMNKEFDRVNNSFSYRLGLIITYVPRRIVNCIKIIIYEIRKV